MSKKPDNAKRDVADPPADPISTGPAGDPPPSSGGGGQADIPGSRPSATKRGPYKRGPYKKHRAAEPNRAVDEIKSKSLAATFKTLHDLVAMLPGFECMAMDNAECKALADAVKQWQDANPDSKLSPKTAAWLTLISTLAVIYGPRGYLIYHTLKVRIRERELQSRPKAPVIKITPREAVPETDLQAGDVEPGA